MSSERANARLQTALADAEAQRSLALEQKQATEVALGQAKAQQTRADEQARIAEDRLARMKAIIARVPDPKLRRQLQADFIPVVAHRAGAFEPDLVAAVHDAVEDRVGQRGVAQVGVPSLDRQLAGDQGTWT